VIKSLNSLKLTLTVILGIFMVIGGLNHFIYPDMYLPFIPGFLPKPAVNLIAGVVELTLGVGVLFPRTRHVSAKSIFLLMCIFLPIHVWDVFREDPAIGTHTAALIRLPVQFVLIYWSWYISIK
jgi:uncharacterized membrane protein